MAITLRAYDKEGHRYIYNIEKTDHNGYFPSPEGYLKDPRFEVQVASPFVDKNATPIFPGDILLLDEEWVARRGKSRKRVLVGFVDGCYMCATGRTKDRFNDLLAKIAPYGEIVGNEKHNLQTLWAGDVFIGSKLRERYVQIWKKRPTKSKSQSKVKRTVSKKRKNKV